MKFLAPAIATLAGVALGDLSAPFRIVVDAGSSSWDKAEVGACHYGAGFNAMCVYQDEKGGKGSVFTFNYTANGQAPSGWTPEGVVTYETSISTPHGPLNQTLVLEGTLLTNMAAGVLSPAENAFTRVGFSDSTQEIALYDRSVDGQTLTPIKRWYICNFRSGWYQYNYLTWIVGAGQPDEHNCVPAQPKRVFV